MLPSAPLGIRALPVDDEPDRDALLRLAGEGVGEAVPTSPGRKPNWLMWIDDRADAMSSSIGG